MAYGSPRTRDDVLPYYTDIRRGRPPTDEQLADLIRRYEAIATDGGDGLSPLAERTEAQRVALQAALDELAPGRYLVALGLKHAAPSVEDAVETMASSGIDAIVGLVLAPHYSALSVGQYLDRLRA
ncbi:MAG: ferrochelatase, partial [Actinobacteria bacterium]|nr:ferrochelatase [Actinomycetota bacterium]